jgi:hypothetical protein
MAIQEETEEKKSLDKKAALQRIIEAQERAKKET